LDKFLLAISIGFLSALCSLPLASSVFGDYAYLFGVKISLIGILGYVILFVLRFIYLSFNMFYLKVILYLLILCLLPITIFLIHRSFVAGDFCPYCFICWCVNIFLFFNVVANIKNKILLLS
jgi:uncharacterized membrane protein